MNADFARPKSSRGRHVNSQQNAAYTYPDEAYATNQTRGRPVVKEQKSYYKPLKTDDDTSQSDIPERPKSSRGRQRQHPDASSSYGESVAQSPSPVRRQRPKSAKGRVRTANRIRSTAQHHDVEPAVQTNILVLDQSNLSSHNRTSTSSHIPSYTSALNPPTLSQEPYITSSQLTFESSAPDYDSYASERQTVNSPHSDVDIITHEQQVFGKQRSPVPTDSAGLTSASMLEGAFNTTTAASPTLRPMSSRSSARPPTAAERKQYAQGANKDSDFLRATTNTPLGGGRPDSAGSFSRYNILPSIGLKSIRTQQPHQQLQQQQQQQYHQQQQQQYQPAHTPYRQPIQREGHLHAQQPLPPSLNTNAVDVNSNLHARSLQAGDGALVDAMHSMDLSAVSSEKTQHGLTMQNVQAHDMTQWDNDPGVIALQSGVTAVPSELQPYTHGYEQQTNEPHTEPEVSDDTQQATVCEPQLEHDTRALVPLDAQRVPESSLSLPELTADTLAAKPTGEEPVVQAENVPNADNQLPEFPPLTRHIHLPLEPRPEEPDAILLAIKLPDGRRVQRHFVRSNTLKIVLNFAEYSAQLDFTGTELVCDAPRHVRFADLSVKICDTGLASRTVLHLQVPDEEL